MQIDKNLTSLITRLEEVMTVKKWPRDDENVYCINPKCAYISEQVPKLIEAISHLSVRAEAGRKLAENIEGEPGLDDVADALAAYHKALDTPSLLNDKT